MVSMQNLIVILIIVVLLFGAKKIPELAKGLGIGIKNFKNAIKEDEAEVKTIEGDKEKEAKTPNNESAKTA
ncbi:MAG: twin-arginine translocase TatA/TatE family subunit [Helicobacteraceae bacterium]|nr:twin-arginine translocase TatA/TatE family subunit [Helicobacteraceae bacterium]